MVHTERYGKQSWRRPARLRLTALLLSLALVVPVTARAQETDPGPFEIDLRLGLGYEAVGPGSTEHSATEDITPGILLSRLIDRIYIYRRIHERLIVDLDYDSARGEEWFLGGENYYALHYEGQPGEFVERASIGNREAVVIEDHYVDTAAPPGRSVGAGISTRAEVGGGALTTDAIVRLGGSQLVSLTFRGQRSVVDLSLRDVDHVRRAIFFLPDENVDTNSLALYRSTTGPGEATVGGKRFTRLQQPVDYAFDSGRSLIILRTPVGESDLIATYTSGSLRVGDAGLGADAYINPSGEREDFSAATHPQQFATMDGVRYLYLAREEMNTYWEHRGAYSVPELAGADLGTLRLELVEADTGRANVSYADVLQSYRADIARGLLIFEPEDPAGFYPRPFPGPLPFTHPVSPDNPFAPDNPVYSALGTPADGASVHTLTVSFLRDATSYLIEDLFVEGSVRVRVDGRELRAGEFQADADTGLVTVQESIITPESEVVITYRLAEETERAQTLLAAVSSDWEREGLSAHAALVAETALPGPEAPAVGEERPATVTGSAAVAYERQVGRTLIETSLRGAVQARNPNSAGAAIVADMSDRRTRDLPLDEVEWQLGSDSDLLPGLSTPVELLLRGELGYENYYEDSAVGGGLRTLGWDNSRNPSFSYAQKAGPYNTADAAPDGAAQSLVLDYAFTPDEPGQYIAAATHVGGRLNPYDTLELVYGGHGLSGGAVRVYLEVLQIYKEDLNANGVLDGQTSVDDPGFAITPTHGTRTVIGSGRDGGSNGRLNSEDLNRNGRLDPPGPPGSIPEKGVVIPGPEGAWIAELRPGAGGTSGTSEPIDWQTVRVNLHSLAAETDLILEDAQAVRITITPAGTPTSHATGRVVINRIRFSSTGITTSDPASLETRTVTSSSVPELASAPLADAFPQMHETMLEVTFVPPLAAGERVSLARELVGPADFTAYETFRIYLYTGDPGSLPAPLAMDVRLLSSERDYHGFTFGPSDLRAGWNEIAIDTDAGQAVRINGRSGGSLETEGRFASLSSVVRVELGIAALGGELVDAFSFWTGAWHVNASRTRLGVAGGASVALSHDGTALGFRGVPVIAHPSAALHYDVSSAGFDGAQAASDDVRVNAGLSFADLFPLAASARQRRWFSAQESEIRASAGFDPPWTWFPRVEHVYGYAVREESAVTRSGLDYLESEETRTDASVRLSGRLSPAEGWSQEASVSRRAVQDARVLRDTDGTDIVSGTAGATLSDELSLSLTGRVPAVDGWRIIAGGDYRRSFSGGAMDALARPWSAYRHLAGNAFSPVSATLSDAALTSTRQSARLALTPPRTLPAGLELALTEQIREGTFRADTRQIGTDVSLRVGLPLLFGPEGTVRVTPSITRSGSAVSRARTSYSEWRLLEATVRPLLMPPFAYITPTITDGRIRERDAAELLAGAADDPAGRASVHTVLGLETRVRSPHWYVPSLLTLEASGAAGWQGPTPTQERSAAVSMSSSAPVAQSPRGAGSLVVSTSGRFERDYLLDTEKLDVNASAYFAYSSVTGRGWQVNQSLSWRQVRQHPGAVRLSLYPDAPQLEPVAAFRADSDRLVNRSSFQFTWRADRMPSGHPSTLARRLGLDGEAQEVTNTERVAVETSHIFADPDTLGTTTLMPLRITLEHRSEITQSENLTLELGVQAQGGIEERIVNGVVDRVPAFGLQADLGVRLRY